MLFVAHPRSKNTSCSDLGEHWVKQIACAANSKVAAACSSLRSWCIPVSLHCISVYHRAFGSVAGVRAGQAGRAGGITGWLDQGLEVSVTALDILLAGKAEVLGRVASGLTSLYFPKGDDGFY